MTHQDLIAAEREVEASIENLNHAMDHLIRDMAEIGNSVQRGAVATFKSIDRHPLITAASLIALGLAAGVIAARALEKKTPRDELRAAA